MSTDTKTIERYLCFSLGSEGYAIPLLTVKEVIALPEVTPVPNTPSHFLGIMNLRGQVISIIDLRAKMGIKASPTSETAVVICDLNNLSLGIVVDAINSVLHPKADEVAERPNLSGNKAAEYVTAVYHHGGDKMLLFLDLNKVFAEDLKLVNKAA